MDNVGPRCWASVSVGVEFGNSGFMRVDLTDDHIVGRGSANMTDAIPGATAGVQLPVHDRTNTRFNVSLDVLLAPAAASCLTVVGTLCREGRCEKCFTRHNAPARLSGITVALRLDYTGICLSSRSVSDTSVSFGLPTLSSSPHTNVAWAIKQPEGSLLGSTYSGILERNLKPPRLLFSEIGERVQLSVGKIPARLRRFFPF